jgi:hypothetical protein
MEAWRTFYFRGRKPWAGSSVKLDVMRRGNSLSTPVVQPVNIHITGLDMPAHMKYLIK